MSQKKQEDWLRAGIDELLQAGGPQGLTIDALCRRLKVTKGSFYHHFNGYDDFKRKLLTFEGSTLKSYQGKRYKSVNTREKKSTPT